MKTLITGFAAILVVALAPQSSAAYSHANRYGGSTSHAYGEGTEHTNAYGGSTAHAWGGGTEHTNVYGGTTEGRYGEGAYHSTPYYGTAYHPPTYAYPYHPPTTVNYYGSGCYNCGGWDAAGAAVAGAVVGATVATAAASSSTTSAYNAGVAAGSAQVHDSYTMGAMYPTLPAGCAKPTVQGVTYYLCGNTWFQPNYGANGVYYKVVPTP
jgi:hypothetical protein